MCLSVMQQSVLMAAVRGPDGLRGDHPVKMILRWYRRCVFISAFDRCVLENPVDARGGKFTGPSVKKTELERACDGHTEWQCDEHCPPRWLRGMDNRVKEYMDAIDQVPLHFHGHLMHAAEVLGYKHPDQHIRNWWLSMYKTFVRALHLTPETENELDFRLGDIDAQWQKSDSIGAGAALSQSAQP